MRSLSINWPVVLVTCLVVFGLAGGAAAQTNISNSSWFSTCPRVAVDPAGNVHAVWVEFYRMNGVYPAEGDAFYSKYTVATRQWSSPINLSNSRQCYSGEWYVVGIDADASGNVYVVYIDRPTIKLRILSGGNWSAPFQVGPSPSGDIDSARVAVDASGNIFVSWCDSGYRVVYSRARVGGVWEGIATLTYPGTVSKFPEISVGTNQVYCVFMDNHFTPTFYTAVYVRRPKTYGAAWSSSQRMTNANTWEEHPAVRVDANDVAHVIYTPYYDSNASRDVRYVEGTSSGFSAPLLLGSMGGVHYPSLSVRGTNVYTCWQSFGVHYRNRIGGAWGAENAVPNLSCYALTDVAASPSQDKVYYVTDTGGGDIYFTELGGPGVPTGPQIKLSRSRLDYGSTIGGTPSQPQDFVVSNSGTGTLSWTVTDDAGWLSCAPASGTGSGEVTVTANATGLGAGTYGATVSVSSGNAGNSPQTVAVTLKVFATGTSSGPFGVLETPADGTSGIEGSVPVTGWALDDIEVTKVQIWREAVAGDPPNPGAIYIGDAVFVEGARSDIEGAYPTYPLNSRAGWGYMILSNSLPNQGNGTFHIGAVAYDKEGNGALIGNKYITCDNAHATLPFGTIDTPAQGGTWNGTQVNFGWALTPQPKSIPTDGSTILLWIDGQAVGHPTYNNYRSDIATLFPGYANSNGAVGYYSVDTTRYANGVHTIAWSVVDSAGKASGIGSRYFTVANTGAGSAASLGEPFSLSISGGSGQAEAASRAEVASIPADLSGPVRVKRGYDPEVPAELIFPDANGVIVIEAQEVGRVEMALSEDAASESSTDRIRGEEQPAGRRARAGDKAGLHNSGQPARTGDQNYAGYLVVGKELRRLPIGSTFDAESGVFAWQLGPGFVGEYNFVFISQAGTSGHSKKNVRVRILPAFQVKGEKSS
jgi:Viral BACON domain